MKVILASASPRRRELLLQIGIHVDVQPADIDESVYPGEDPDIYVGRMAVEKAKALAGKLPVSDDCLIIAADTSVVIDNHILGKPADRNDAFRILRLLSGRTHHVLTAVSVLCRRNGHDSERSCLVNTAVTFRALTDDEIADYWGSGEPADKAGAYGIQGRGGAFVRSINGSYSAVVGLPLCETAELLGSYGVR